MNPTCKTTVTLNIVIILLLLTGFTQKPKNTRITGNQPDVFRAAVVKTNITPQTPQYLIGYNERQSTGVNDSIFQKVLLLDDGKSQFVLVSTEICILSRIEYDLMAKKIKDEFGIEPSNFWWSTSHTHSAPEVGEPGIYQVYMGERNKHKLDMTYTTFIEQKIMEGIREARSKLAPARLGVGWGYSSANINRRAIDVDGKASLGLNPDGPVDRKIGLLRIDKVDGSPIALVANYAIHGTVMNGSNLLISGDAPGIVSEYVESKTGAPVLFVNGAAGNLAPIYSVYPTPRAGHLGEFRVLLGDKILEAYKKINTSTDKVTFQTESITVETPRKEGMGWPENWGKYTRTTKNGENMVLLPIGLLKINSDIAIWNAPVELFCEISNEIRDRSNVPYTFYFGYTNGWFGYFVAESQYKHEGYGPRVSPMTQAAHRHLAETLVPYLNGEKRSEPVKKNRK